MSPLNRGTRYAVMHGGGRDTQPNEVSDLQLWVDATDNTTITIATGVSAWTDKSGNSNDFSQGTAAAQPALGSIGSKQALDFDGSDDSMSATGVTYTTLGMAGAYTILCVAKADAITNAAGNPWEDENVYGETGGYWGLALNNAPGVRAWHFDASAKATTSQSITLGAAFLSTATFDGTTLSLSIDQGTAQTVTTDNPDVATGVVRVGRSSGGSSLLEGQIGELLVYGRALSSSEISKLETYLKNKWGV